MGISIHLDQLELGQLYYKACDFERAIQALRAQLPSYQEQKKWKEWSKALSFLVRMYAERLEFDQLHELLENINTVASAYKDSSLEYAKGIAKTYSGDLDQAKDLFSNAIELAQNQGELIQAKFGLAAIAAQKNQNDICLSLLDLILLDSKTEDLITLKIAALLLKARCHREKQQFQVAYQVIEEAEQLCHLNENFYMVINAIFARATTYQSEKRFETALHYFDLCEKLLREKDLKHTKQQIVQRRVQIQQELTSVKKKIILQEGEESFLKVDGSLIRCHGQQILLKLLSFIGSSQNQPKSKEEIVQFLWSEEYHPLRHDNKVYVTIKRLRSLLAQEDKELEKRLLLKTEQGYQLSSQYHFQLLRKGA